jgi:putative spermidine/putrescine transport system ATP-binding protein/spermidine/putrescine transport system ATP-binding protein
VAVRAERLMPVMNASAAAPGFNMLACRPSRHVYRGKYTDQMAATPSEAVLKIRTWDQRADPGAFNAVTCRAQDCVLLPN